MPKWMSCFCLARQCDGLHVGFRLWAVESQMIRFDLKVVWRRLRFFLWVWDEMLSSVVSLQSNVQYSIEQQWKTKKLVWNKWKNKHKSHYFYLRTIWFAHILFLSENKGGMATCEAADYVLSLTMAAMKT